MIILVDMDGVLENLSEEWVRLLNRQYGTDVSPTGLQNWNMKANFPTLTADEIKAAELNPELYYKLKPLEGAQEILKRLKDEGHEIYIVTNTPHEIVSLKMTEVLFKLYPFLSWKDVIITAHKQLVKGDVLIDDAPQNLIGGSYHKILMDASYNRNIDDASCGITRVKNWQEVYEQIEKIKHMSRSKR